MSDVSPGKKVYLFTGAAGNALDGLVRAATHEVDHLTSLRPPVSSTDLSVTLGNAEETHTTIIRGIEEMSAQDWALIEKYLAPNKVKGRSMILVGESETMPKGLREKIKRQGQLVDVSSPTGQVARKELETRIAKEWNTTAQAATLACQRADYSVETLVWTQRAWLSATNGKSVTGNLALKLVESLVPQSHVDSVYRTLLDRRPLSHVSLLPEEALGLFKALESALTDIELIGPVLSTGASLKTVSGRTGLHIIRVMDLSPLVARYPPGAVAKCRQALAFGFAHHREPEAGSVVAMLWG